MAYDKLNTKQLSKKIKERKKFLTDVVNFTEKLLSKMGRVVEKHQESWYTNIVKQLDLDHFSFLADWSQTAFGGNDVKILYYDVLVLHVYYQPTKFDIDDSSVETFDTDRNWQTAIKRVIKNKDSVFAQLSRQSKKPSVQIRVAKRCAKITAARVRVENEAKRLGVNES